MPPIKALLLACAFAALVAGPAAAAGHLTGTVTLTSTPPEVTPLVSGGKMMVIASKGVMLVDDAASPLNLSSIDCTGAYVADTQGQPAMESGSCAIVDRDGDTWSLWYENKGDRRTWTVIGGTGKYAAMTGGGTDKELLTTDDGRDVISIEADLKM